MKKIIRIILGLLLVGLIVFGIYKFFFDCQKVNTEFAKYFTLQEMDYAVIGDEVTLKFLETLQTNVYNDIIEISEVCYE